MSTNGTEGKLKENSCSKNREKTQCQGLKRMVATCCVKSCRETKESVCSSKCKREKKASLIAFKCQRAMRAWLLLQYQIATYLLNEAVEILKEKLTTLYFGDLIKNYLNELRTLES